MPTTLQYPAEFSPTFTPLVPGEGLGQEADFALWELAMHGFVAAVGVHRSQLDTLAAIAKQPHIKEFCPNDEGRFGSLERVQSWLEKGRLMVGIYAVADRTQLSLADIPHVSEEDVTQATNGWSGEETNKHIPGANITTAYRVSELGRQLAFERRQGSKDKFKLGLPLGHLVIATATHIAGADPKLISLETWKSNGANNLYDALGFIQPVGVEPMEDSRPTLQEVGTEINGNVVYYDLKKQQNMVVDARLFKVYAPAAQS